MILLQAQLAKFKQLKNFESLERDDLTMRAVVNMSN